MRYSWALILLLAHSAPAARVVAFVTNSVVFQNTPNVTPLALSGPASSTSAGSPTGPNFVLTSLSAAGTPYAINDPNATGFYGHTEMDLTAGAGSSFTNATAEGISGAVRLTNSSSNPVQVAFDWWVLSDASAFGPGSAFIEVQLPVERFNSATQQWEGFNTFSFNLNSGETNQACASICKGLSFVNLDANSSADFRVRSHLRANAFQSGGTGSPPTPATVPEPATFLLTAGGAILLGAKCARGPGRKS